VDAGVLPGRLRNSVLAANAKAVKKTATRTSRRGDI
jgi:hypothetical protein